MGGGHKTALGTERGKLGRSIRDGHHMTGAR